MTTELPKIKDPKTYKQQVEIFQSRGLIIPNEDKAINMLKRVNYYRLSAYALTLKKSDKFFDGVTIDNVYALYEFDRRLRALIMGALENIEVAFRTHIAYLLAHEYGPIGYLNADNFNNVRHHIDFIEHFTNELGRANELFVKHHKENYGGQFPIWVATEVLSFGNLSKLFSIMKNEDKQQLSKEHYNVPHYYVSTWLHFLAIVRNICAHYGRLYDRKINIYMRFSKEDANLGIDTTRIFAAIFVMKKLYLDRSTWNDFVTNLQALIEQYSDVDCKLLGFCDDWQKILKA